jgi:hypothetical protein
MALSDSLFCIEFLRFGSNGVSGGYLSQQTEPLDKPP